MTCCLLYSTRVNLGIHSCHDVSVRYNLVNKSSECFISTHKTSKMKMQESEPKT